jgi:hypothetical protein
MSNDEMTRLYLVPDLLIFFFIALPLITSIRVADLFYILASIVNLVH